MEEPEEPFKTRTVTIKTGVQKALSLSLSDILNGKNKDLHKALKKAGYTTIDLSQVLTYLSENGFQNYQVDLPEEFLHGVYKHWHLDEFNELDDLVRDEYRKCAEDKKTTIRITNLAYQKVNNVKWDKSLSSFDEAILYLLAVSDIPFSEQYKIFVSEFVKGCQDKYGDEYRDNPIKCYLGYYQEQEVNLRQQIKKITQETDTQKLVIDIIRSNPGITFKVLRRFTKRYDEKMIRDAVEALIVSGYIQSVDQERKREKIYYAAISGYYFFNRKMHETYKLLGLLDDPAE
jgi:hypothetical protein